MRETVASGLSVASLVLLGRMHANPWWREALKVRTRSCR